MLAVVLNYSSTSPKCTWVECVQLFSVGGRLIMLIVMGDSAPQTLDFQTIVRCESSKAGKHGSFEKQRIRRRVVLRRTQ